MGEDECVSMTEKCVALPEKPTNTTKKMFFKQTVRHSSLVNINFCAPRHENTSLSVVSNFGQKLGKQPQF